jgi:hypothetical protein
MFQLIRKRNNSARIVTACEGGVKRGNRSSAKGRETAWLEDNRTSLTLNNFDYHLQELAFFSWFYGGNSMGVGGKFSNNGTFATGARAVCKLTGN